MSTEKRENWYGYLFLASEKQEVINTVKAAQALKTTPSGTPTEIYAKYAKRYAIVHNLQPANEGPTYTSPATGETVTIPDMNLTTTEAANFYGASIKADEIKKALEAAKNQTDPSEDDTNYRWNLPPHRWSMPYRPSAAYPYKENDKTDFDGISDFIPDANARALRRGRIRWRWANSGQQILQAGQTIPENMGADDARKYGFQFIWNPEQFGTTTAISYSTTPSANDFMAAAPGYFPGVQSMSLNIRLDRTNDFACFRGLEPKSGPDLWKRQINWKYWYPENIPGESMFPTYEQKVYELLTIGTMADVDYLLSTINDRRLMKNNLGKIQTADAGFLAFNPVEFTLGPLGYIGYIVGLSVNHIGFTEDYIPIRTDLTITANMMANSTTVAGGAEATTYAGEQRPAPGLDQIPDPDKK